MCSAKTQKSKSNGIRFDNLGIAVDYFHVARKRHLRHFFLTHAHSDHTDGLRDSFTSPIYCSKITADVASAITNLDRRVFRELTFDETHEIRDAGGKLVVKVQLIDANHCPGSAMFLFEGEFGRILCTGDFRFEIGAFRLSKINRLKEAPIDRVYLDTTNWTRDADRRLPPRSEVVRAIVERAKSLPRRCAIIITGPSYYLGREDLLMEMALAFGEPICVEPEKMAILQILQCLDVFVTNRDEARIFVTKLNDVRMEFDRLKAKFGDVFVIIASSLAGNLGVKLDESCVFRAPYSDHCSREELEHFLKLSTFRRIVGIPFDLTADEHDRFAVLTLKTQPPKAESSKGQRSDNVRDEPLPEICIGGLVPSPHLSFSQKYKVDTSDFSFTTNPEISRVMKAYFAKPPRNFVASPTTPKSTPGGL